MLISSRDNPRIKQLSKLLSSKKARNETGLFVIEGLRGCCDALRSALTDDGLDIEAVYYVPEMTDAHKESFPVELIYRLEENKRFEISRAIADRIGDAESSQGIFITAKKTDIPLSGECIHPDGKYLVLDSLQDPGNLGTVIRTADAVGISGIILTGNCVELYNPKVVRSAVGSLPRVKVFIENDRGLVFEILAEKGISARVIDMYCIKPIDEEAIIKAAKETKNIVTVEEHSIIGGLGSMVSAVTAQNAPCKVRILGLPDAELICGTQEEIFDHEGLTPEGIACEVEKLINK